MIPSKTGTPGDFHWVVLISSIVGSAVIAAMMGQDAGFDLLNYHYYSGFAFLSKPFGYDFAPSQIQTFYNPLLHVFTFAVFSNLPAKAAVALFGAVQGLNFYLVFRISQVLFSGFRPVYRYILGLGLACAGFYGIASVTELGATYGDNLVSIPVLLGLLLILGRLRNGSLEERNTVAVFAAAGFAIGAALGLKPTCANYALAVAVSVPLIVMKKPNWLRVTGALWVGLFLGFVVLYGFWGARLYSAYQNPFFPYLNHLFRSPYFDASNFLDERFFPRNWQQLVFYPFFFVRKTQLVSELELRDIRLALCYVAIVISAVAGLHRLYAGKREKSLSDFCFSFLAWFFVISYVSWLHMSSFYRYLAVLELTAPAFLALTISRFSRKQSLVVGFSMVLCVAIIAAAYPINFGRQQFDDNLLKVQAPDIRELNRCVILMSGYEPTAFIVPSFPATTRFVRVSSTFTSPGKIEGQRREITSMLASYDDSHTFGYVRSGEEMGLARLDMSVYGRSIDPACCFEVRSSAGNRGYLCALVGADVGTKEKHSPRVGYFPGFKISDRIALNTRLLDKYIEFTVAGMKMETMDILYQLNGELMPSIRNWPMATTSSLRLGPLSRTGEYKIIGIRDSRSPDPDTWIKVSSSVDFPHGFIKQ